jgi:small subunit ribosomal protein S2
MAVISMKQFLEAGAHFGHQTKRWNPKMSPYIYGAKAGIHVIDLRHTLKRLKEAYEYIKEEAGKGKTVMFVGTKPQIQRIIKEESLRSGSHYINYRWLGGMLTNFSTVRQSINRLQEFDEMAGESNNYDGLIKKEALRVERKREKLERSLGGVKTMRSIPDILFVVDAKKEHLAVKEGRRLGIPIVGIADTNCDPTELDIAIPGNDDSPRAVKIFAGVIANAILEGRAQRDSANGIVRNASAEAALAPEVTQAPEKSSEGSSTEE